MEGPRIHCRLFDVALETHRWLTTRLETGESSPPVLPPVNTPDHDLRSLIDTYRAENLVDERQYWGVESGDDCFVLVQEADGSKRLLRDCEQRARGQLTWGYGGTGPYELGEVLVVDMLGILAYCPSCFGAITAGGGFVECPSCDGQGLRQNDLWSLHEAFYHITASLSKKPDPSLQKKFKDTPPKAQWRLSRRDLLQRAFDISDDLATDYGIGEDQSEE